MRVTAKQLAEKAGVSQATVSLVLHGKPGVSEKVRRQVLALAEEMGLEPHTSAPASNGKNLQLVIYKRHGKVMADLPFFEQLTQGVAGAGIIYPSVISTATSPSGSRSKALPARTALG